MACPHDISERETACADGMCPICANATIDRLDAKIDQLRSALHTIFCNTEVDAIPHPSYDILAQVICETAATALGYENCKPTLDQVYRALDVRDRVNQQTADVSK